MSDGIFHKLSLVSVWLRACSGIDNQWWSRSRGDRSRSFGMLAFYKLHHVVCEMCVHARSFFRL